MSRRLNSHEVKSYLSILSDKSLVIRSVDFCSCEI